MKKESVNKFNLEAAFKALDEIEIPVVKGIRPNRENLQEKFTKKLTSDVLVEDYYDINDHSDLEAAQEEREAEIAKAKLARIEKIVDLDAESEEDLLPSYVGKLIIQCPQCMTLFYKKEEDIATSEENPDVVNINEPCQHCGNSSGYTLIGKVDQVGEEEAAEYDVEDFDDNELNLDFENDFEEETEKVEEPVEEEGTVEEGNEEELELEPIEDEEEVTESLTLNEDVEDDVEVDEENDTPVEDEIEEEEVEETSEEAIEEEPVEEILTSVEEVKEIAAEAGEEVAEVVKENPEVEAEEIKEITDEVVEATLEVEEKSEEEVVEDEISEEDEVEEEVVEESLTESVDKELDDKLKAHNEYIEYLKEMIEKEEKSLANAKNDFVKKSIQSRIDALKADLEAALPEALKDEVTTELPTAEEVELEATENKEEKEDTNESLNESLEEDTVATKRVRSRSKAEVIALELRKHPLFRSLSTRTVQRLLIPYFEDCFGKEDLSVERMVEFFSEGGFGTYVFDEYSSLDEATIKEVGSNDPLFVEALRKFAEKYNLMPEADEQITVDFNYLYDVVFGVIRDDIDAEFETLDEIQEIYSSLIPEGVTTEALVGDVNINLDARGQSVGLLKGQGGEVHNDMTEDKENLDEFIGPAVASIAGAAAASSVANSAANAVSSLVSEEVEEPIEEATATKVRSSSKRELFAKEVAADPYFAGLSTRDIERWLISVYLQDDPDAELSIEALKDFVEDLGWGKIIIDNLDEITESQAKHLAEKDPTFVEVVDQYLKEDDYLLDRNYSVNELISELFIFLGKKPGSREEAADFSFDPKDSDYKFFKSELASMYIRKAVLVSENLTEEAGDLDALLDSPEFKKPISEQEVDNIIAKYESVEEPITEAAEVVEPGVESEIAIQDIVDTWESVEEIDEESLNKLTENYLTNVYSNVKSFKAVDCSLDSNKLIIEGTITFNSGKTKNTKFIYEAKIEDHKFIL